MAIKQFQRKILRGDKPNSNVSMRQHERGMGPHNDGSLFYHPMDTVYVSKEIYRSLADAASAIAATTVTLAAGDAAATGIAIGDQIEVNSGEFYNVDNVVGEVITIDVGLTTAVAVGDPIRVHRAMPANDANHERKLYKCLVAHNSDATDFDTDLQAGYWEEISAAAVEYEGNEFSTGLVNDAAATTTVITLDPGMLASAVIGDPIRFNIGGVWEESVITNIAGDVVTVAPALSVAPADDDPVEINVDRAVSGIVPQPDAFMDENYILSAEGPMEWKLNDSIVAKSDNADDYTTNDEAGNPFYQLRFWRGDQENYDGIVAHDDNTLYIVDGN